MLCRFARMPPRRLGVSALLLGEGFGRTVAAGQVRFAGGGPTDGAGFLRRTHGWRRVSAGRRSDATPANGGRWSRY